jgi:hypothetical protein
LNPLLPLLAIFDSATIGLCEKGKEPLTAKVAKKGFKDPEARLLILLVSASFAFLSPRTLRLNTVYLRQGYSRRDDSATRKKTGLVGPVSHGVELDAVTSQRGATGAKAAFLVGLGPVRLPGYASPGQSTDRRFRSRIREARKQTAGEMQTACQAHTSSQKPQGALTL